MTRAEASIMMSRIFVEAIKAPLNVPVVPVNKPGAGGSIGTMFVLNTKPDGYTVGACSLGSLLISPIVEPKLPYKRSDLTVVCKTINFPIGHLCECGRSMENLEGIRGLRQGRTRVNCEPLSAARPVRLRLLLESLKIQAGGLNIINIPSKGGASHGHRHSGRSCRDLLRPGGGGGEPLESRVE